MKKSILLLLYFFCCNLIIGQNNVQLIEKHGQYYQNDRKVIPEKLLFILSNDTACLKTLNLSNKFSDIGNACVIVGGSVAIGSGLYLALALTDPYATITYAPVTVSLIGLGICLSSIPFYVLSKSYLKSSIEIYNSKSRADMNRFNKIELNFGATSNGVGIVCRF
ncbi:MAG: hypothetical protein WCK78_01980 [Paludibacter sp.]